MNAHNPLLIRFNPQTYVVLILIKIFHRVANAKYQLIHTQCESSVMDKMSTIGIHCWKKKLDEGN